MLVVGLTGNIGSGKSTVAQMIARRGVTVIDADMLARESVAPGSAALPRIVERWGRGILAPDGSLDRAALRARVFGHLAELDALNTIMHPEIGRRRDRLIAEARRRGERVVLCDIPLLFEVKLDRAVDVVILVDAARETRLERLVAGRGLVRSVAAAIMATQLTSEHTRERADFVIDNDGTLDHLEALVNEVWRAVEKLASEASA
ncbi:MAG TPA: dephospho-CoA kinase [Gemmatimonadaceae bacterium]|nr:dephospho-CoA kinase [Gemmatimonadaceae bacterium]